MLFPKLRIYFADFPWSHCSIDQRLFTSESGCGYRYGPSVREELLRCRKGSQRSKGFDPLRSTGSSRPVWSIKWIAGGAFRRIVRAPRTALKVRRFPYGFRRLSPSETRFKASATSKRKDNSPQARQPWTHRCHLLYSLVKARVSPDVPHKQVSECWPEFSFALRPSTKRERSLLPP